MNRPFVSICVPAYNAARWIGEAIDSALAQTYDAFELLVVDNASVDTTREIVSRYHDPRLRLVRASRQLGAIANHNRTIALSRGELIKFLHADDLLLPRCVEAMVEVMQADPAVGLVFAPREVLVEADLPPEDRAWATRFARPHERLHDLGRINGGGSLLRQLLEGGLEENWIGEPSAVLLNRRALARVGLFNVRIRQLADLELWLRIMRDFKVGFVDETLSVYRHHGGSGTAENARTGRDWLDGLWLAESLLAGPAFAAADARRLKGLRRAAVRHALRAQLKRVVQRRWDGGLFEYASYRARRRLGRAPALHPALDDATSADVNADPAVADPATPRLSRT